MGSTRCVNGVISAAFFLKKHPAVDLACERVRGISVSSGHQQGNPEEQCQITRPFHFVLPGLRLPRSGNFLLSNIANSREGSECTAAY